MSAAYAKKTAPPPFCFFFLLSSFISLCLFRACLGKSSSLFMRKKTQSKRAVFFFRSQDRGQDRRRRVRKRHFFRHLYIKCIILPRQARDKHRETLKKWPFSAGSRRVGTRSKGSWRARCLRTYWRTLSLRSTRWQRQSAVRKRCQRQRYTQYAIRNAQ